MIDRQRFRQNEIGIIRNDWSVGICDDIAEAFCRVCDMPITLIDNSSVHCINKIPATIQILNDSQLIQLIVAAIQSIDIRITEEEHLLQTAVRTVKRRQIFTSAHDQPFHIPVVAAVKIAKMQKIKDDQHGEIIVIAPQCVQIRARRYIQRCQRQKLYAAATRPHLCRLS